jgi:hypothetical protein
MGDWRARRDSNYYTNVFTYREFFVKIWSEGQVEGQAEGVPLDLVGVLRQNPRATGKIGILIPPPRYQVGETAISKDCWGFV